MTAMQLIWMTCGYTVFLVAVIFFTRALPRRVCGALVGGAIAGCLIVGVIPFGGRFGWWHWEFHVAPQSKLVVLLYMGALVSCSPVFLITWRVARRFGWRGLTLSLALAAIVGPPRDYLIAKCFPEWGRFAPGISPVIVVALVYSVLVVAGHQAMRLVAGPAHGDQLARQPTTSR